MATVGFLHTAQVHVDTFEALARAESLESDHIVRADWLEEAQTCGLSAGLTQRVRADLETLADRCDVVVCTCSTLGAVATQVGSANVFRVDQPMMVQAAESEGTPLLAFCLESTRQTSAELLEEALRNVNREDAVCFVDCSSAWQHFETGDTALFGQAIAKLIRQQLERSRASDAGSVVLAQASMAAAIPFLSDLDLPVLASPSTAVQHAARLLKR